jgi:hypothetical protein
VTTEVKHPKTNGGRRLKRGDSYDIECGRTTHRLRLGQHILSSLGVEAKWPEHDEKCILNPKNSWNRCSGWSYRCQCSVGTDPQPSWPEWATDEMFDLAYRLADEVQTERGSYNRSQAYESKRVAEAAARAEVT